MVAPSYVYDLLASEQFARWGGGSPVGTPVTITYSFPTAQSASTNYANFKPSTPTEVTAIKSALAVISALTRITFVEAAANDGALQFANADLTPFGPGTAGRANYSYTSAGIGSATVVLSNTGAASLANSDFTPGSITADDIGGRGWSTLLHEIGHALGLKHPFETNIAGDPNSVLPAAEDDYVHTLMSYTPYQPSDVAIVTFTGGGGFSYQSSALNPQTYSLYDIAALQYLYGANAAASLNGVVSFSPTDPAFKTIYATGPNSTIDLSALTGDNIVDMRAGATSDLAIGQTLPEGIFLPDRYDGSSALTIAFGASIAKFIGGSGADSVTGNSANNTIEGRNGNDVLDGGGGGDTLNGGLGDDRYFADASDVIVEAVGGGALDTVFVRANFTLAAGVEVEKLSTTSVAGLTAINLAGNEFAQTVSGNDGVNIIDGGGNADYLAGYKGNDTYIVDDIGDKVVDGTGQGTLDTVRTKGGYALGIGAQIERFWAFDPASTLNFNMTGNEFAQEIQANAGKSRILGGGGADVIKGFGGNDTFVYTNIGQSGPGAARDIIQDFEDYGDNDTIDLSGFAGTLTYKAALAFDGLNQVRAYQSGSHVIVQINTVGSNAADAEIVLGNTKIAAVDIGDFLLV